MKQVLGCLLLATLISCTHGRKPQKREFIENGTVRPVSSFDSSIPGFNLPNLHILEQHDGKITALRGNMPRSTEDFAELKRLGVSNILIFKNEKNGEIKKEINILKRNGFDSQKISHIDFDWKDNANFNSGCLKILTAFDLIQQAYNKKENLFFHCTTGEDRTGMLSALYLKYRNPNLIINDLFKNEMCHKGYESAEYYKPADVVEKIRGGLTKTFLKMYYVIDKYQKEGKTISKDICSYNFQNDTDFQFSEFTNAKKYNCSNEEFKYAY